MDKIDMYEAVVRASFPLVPALGNEDFLRNSLQDLLKKAPDPILARGEILGVRILPATAGEEDLQELGQFANVEQFRQIAPIIRATLPGVDVHDMKLHQTTVIVAKVGFPDGKVGSITISLPDGITNILD